MCGLLLLAKGFLAAPWMIWMAGTQRNWSLISNTALTARNQYNQLVFEEVLLGGQVVVDWLVIPFFPCISKLVDPSLKDYVKKKLKNWLCLYLASWIIVVNGLSSWLTHNVGPWGPLDFTTQPTSPTFSHFQPFWGHATLGFLDLCISPHGSLSSHPLGGECLSDGWRSSEHDRGGTVYHCGSTCLSGCVFSSSGPMLGKRIPVYSEILKVFSLNSASICMFEHVLKDNLHINWCGKSWLIMMRPRKSQNLATDFTLKIIGSKKSNCQNLSLAGCQWKVKVHWFILGLRSAISLPKIE